MRRFGTEAVGSLAGLVLFLAGAVALVGGSYALIGAPNSPLGGTTTTESDKGVPEPNHDGFELVFGPAGCMQPANSGEARCSWTFDARGGEAVLLAHDRGVVKGMVAVNKVVILDSNALASSDEHKAPVKLDNGTNTVDVVIAEKAPSGLKLAIGRGHPTDKPRPVFGAKCVIEANDTLPKFCDYAFKSPVDQGVMLVDYWFGRKLTVGDGIELKEYAQITLNGNIVAGMDAFPPPNGHFDRKVRLETQQENKLRIEIAGMPGSGVALGIFDQLPPPPPPPGDQPIFAGGCKIAAGAPDPVVCSYVFKADADMGVMVARMFGPTDGAVALNGQLAMELKGPGDNKVEVPLLRGENHLDIKLASGAEDSGVEILIFAGAPPPPPPPGDRPIFVGDCFLGDNQADIVCPFEFRSDVKAGVVVLHWKGVTAGGVFLNGKLLQDRWPAPDGAVKIPVDLLDVNKAEIGLKAPGPAAIHMEVWAA